MTFQVGGIKDWQFQLNVGILTSSIHPRASHGMGPGFVKPVNAISFFPLPNPSQHPSLHRCWFLLNALHPKLPLKICLWNIQLAKSGLVEHSMEKGERTKHLTISDTHCFQKKINLGEIPIQAAVIYENLRNCLVLFSDRNIETGKRRPEVNLKSIISVGLVQVTYLIELQVPL